MVKYCGLKRLSLKVVTDLIIDAEIATANASDNIEIHLKIKKCIQLIPTSDFISIFYLSSGTLYKV